MNKNWLLGGVLLFLLPPLMHAEITIRVTDIDLEKGSAIGWQVFSSEESRKNDESILSGYEEILLSTTSYTFSVKDLSPGEYMILGVHDSNHNRVMDYGIFRIPKEGFFSSGNSKRPKFRKSRFHYDGKDMSMILTMKYY